MAKSSTMYVWIMVTWLLCVAWFIPRFASLWRTLDSSLLQTLLVFVLFCLAIFWFYGIHFYAFFLFTHLERRRKRLSRPPRRKPQPHPQVAILYPTADDFEYRAALSCVNQAYPSFHVFLLDDSSREEYHTRVDAFHLDFPRTTTVMRRENREGFKAGNLNNALAMVGCDHEFFAICDADNILPTDFLTQLTPYLQEDSCLGFVQANHRINGLQNESFVQDFHRLVDVGWDHHHLPRNRYGLAFCFGHGVVLRTEAWKQVGGFPLMVSEDIALTLSMRRQGYFGRHVPEVICGEGIPLTLRTWRKRHFRMVTADLECFFRAVVPFIWSKEVTLVEKVDATVCTLRITLSALFLPFLLASSFLLLALEESSEPASVLTSWDFLMVNLLVASGGYVRFVSDLFPQVGNAARLISQITALQLSLFLTSILGVFTYGVTRRAHFFVTAAPAGSDGPVKGTSFLGCLAALNPNHTMVLAAEAILSLLLAYFALTTLNWVMLAVSLSVFVMLLRHRLGWDWLPGRVLVHAPTLLLLLAVFSGLPGVPGLPGQVLILASLSVLVYS